jgi:AcrR family transcriptional regulator
MLGSARKLFHRKGFDGTSTREISGEAGVSESMLFRHFGSKNAIFQEAVLKPFVEFVHHYISDWTLSFDRRAPTGATGAQLCQRAISSCVAITSTS